MTPVAWVVLVVAAVVVAAVLVVRRNRSPQSSVDSFRRQIDALGPAARRTVVDQVQASASREHDPGDPDPEPDDQPDDLPDDKGGPRGA